MLDRYLKFRKMEVGVVIGSFPEIVYLITGVVGVVGVDADVIKRQVVGRALILCFLWNFVYRRLLNILAGRVSRCRSLAGRIFCCDGAQ